MKKRKELSVEEQIAEFRKRLLNTRKAKGFSGQEKLAEAIGRNYQSIGDWETGKDDKVPRLDDFLKICEVLDVDKDYLLGITEEPNIDAVYIHEQTGLTRENAKKLIDYNKNQEPMNRQRISAINAILSNEHGLQIIENMIAYATVDIDGFIIDTPYGAHGGVGDDFALIGYGSGNEIPLGKEDMPKIFLTAIMTQLEKWREEEQKNKRKAARKKAKEG